MTRKNLFLLFFICIFSTGFRVPNRAAIKVAKGKKVTVSGVAEMKIQIPAAGRHINGGTGWFENCHADDFVEIDLVNGSDEVVGSFTDGDLPAANRGWYIPKPLCYLIIDTLTSGQDIPGGMFLRIRATKGDLSADTFRFNLKWGK